MNYNCSTKVGHPTIVSTIVHTALEALTIATLRLAGDQERRTSVICGASWSPPASSTLKPRCSGLSRLKPLLAASAQ
jgi:hypothetical protein